MQEALLTPAEAARLLGCTPKRVQQLADLGKLPVQRDARNWRLIPRSAVEARVRELGVHVS